MRPRLAEAAHRRCRLQTQQALLPRYHVQPLGKKRPRRRDRTAGLSLPMEEDAHGGHAALCMWHASRGRYGHFLLNRVGPRMRPPQLRDRSVRS
jgi:hypothetical protein